MSPADAVAALVHAYAERLDAGDLDGVAALFADAVWRSSARPDGVRGVAAVRRLYDDVLLYDGVPCTKHVITNLVVAPDPDVDRMTARSYFTVLQARPDLPLQPIIAGRYHDAFARDDVRGWHFAERLILPDLVGDLSRHLRSARR
jgi:3-phenylpropionate/cinnamic acid dioxygenase small subunit